MSNLKKVLSFSVQYVGDGTSTTLILDFSKDPVHLGVDSAGNPFPLGIFGQSIAYPSAALSVTATFGPAVSSFSYNASMRQLTINFATTPTSGTVGSIAGQMEYD